MNKHDILEMAKKENNREYEDKIQFKSDSICALSAIIFGIIWIVITYVRYKTFNYSVFSLMLISTGLSTLYEGIKLKKYILIIISSFVCLFSIAIIIYGGIH